MSQETQKNPGTGAWFALNFLGLSIPMVVVVLVSVANVTHLETTFKAVVGYSVVLLIAFTLYAISVGTLVFQRTWPGPWELIEGVVLGILLLGGIGAGVGRFFNAPPSATEDFAVWFSIQIAIVLGVLFYCSALKSWNLRQQEERYLDGLAGRDEKIQQLSDELERVVHDQQSLVDEKEAEIQRLKDELRGLNRKLASFRTAKAGSA